MPRAHPKSRKPKRAAKNVGMVSRKNIPNESRRLMMEKWRPIGLGIILVVLTIAAFGPALWGGFIWDDDQHLTANPCIVGPLGFKGIWTTSSAVYYPLVLTSFWIEHAIWGLNPFFFHLVNVLMHALNAILLWRALLRLGVSGAWLGAALWALHPVQVESVAWITELKNTQSCFFYLLAMLFFLKWRAVAEGANKGAKVVDYTLVLLFATFAMLSKTSTVMLPVVLALCWWWTERSWRWRNLMWLLPFLLVSIEAGSWTIWEQKFHSAALGEEWSQSGLERLAIAGKTVWFYLGKLLWPHPLVFVYPRWQVDAFQALSLAPLVAVILVWFILWLGRDRWRLRAGFFAFTYFLVSLFPVMGFFNVYFFRYSFVGDHFQYLASMSILALVATTLTRLPKPMQILPVILLAPLLVLTWQQTKIYHDQETLWRDTLAKNPRAWMAHDNLGTALGAQGKLTEAIQHFEEAIQIKPDDARAYNNLGSALLLEGKVPEAIQQYERAVQLKPDSADFRYNLGLALARAGKPAEAIQHYERAIQLKPDDAAAYDGLGNVLAGQGKLSEAIQHYERALQLKPDNASAYSNLGSVLILQGNLPEAIQRYQQAIQLKPESADFWYNLGLALARQGKRSEAIQHYQRAIQLKPDDAEVLRTLAAAYAEDGRYAEAVEAANRAIERANAQGNSDLVRTLQSLVTVYEARAAGRSQ